MKTKVKILQTVFVADTQKRIEFVKVVQATKLSYTKSLPTDFKNIELISKNYRCGFDLMFAYNDDRRFGAAFLGHFNSGNV